MTHKPLEVLGVGSLNEGRFLVYFSDKTYATVSSSQLARLFPDRQAIPEKITGDFPTGPGLHASFNPRTPRSHHGQTH